MVQRCIQTDIDFYTGFQRLNIFAVLELQQTLFGNVTTNAKLERGGGVEEWTWTRD